MAGKLRALLDKISGTVRVDNTKDPASAYSMMMRKSRSAKPAPRIKELGEVKPLTGVGGKTVPFRNDRQKYGTY